MKTKIHVICSALDSGARKLIDLKPHVENDTEISLSFLDIGSDIIESDVQYALSFPGVIQKAVQAEREGAHAIVIESMGDSGLSASREMVSIPVIGCSDTAMRVACMLGNKFSILTPQGWHAKALHNLAKTYGVLENIASFRSIHIPSLDVALNRKEIDDDLLKAAREAIEKDGADTILFGGTYLMGHGQLLQERLLKLGHHISVVDPLPLAIRFAKTLVDLKMAHSKKAYAFPPSDGKIIGYGILNRG